MSTIPTPADFDIAIGMPSVDQVRRLEELILQAPQVDLGTRHVVFGGMCARTIFVPAGTVLTGALTNIDNICVINGDITVTTDEGPKHLVGFNVLPACKGAKRVGIAHADTWWTTLWKTDLEDVTEIEDEFTTEASQLQTRRPAIEFERTPLLEG